ncbi:MAG TPA: hypothetical protein VFS26_10570 [Solirubrobacterales bacterium]|nr:hypothetical protein [Solirubrobacterales bacterium]
MIGTYAAVVAIGVASLSIGQAALGLCGRRRWSWLAPAVGLGLLLVLCWGTVRLPGDGAVSAVLVPTLTIASTVYLRGRVEGGGEALRAGWPVALGALLACSLPFAVEGHFGILGTGFNPDMSQHLLATDRLAEGHSSQLLNQGYPLGPHAVVVALNKGLGIGLVHGFSGLTIAVAVLASLTALAVFADSRPVPRTAAALLVGLTYLAASYLAQGAFKETMQALFLLAFVLALREAGRSWNALPLRFIPAALIAAGSTYAYGFPSLIWLGGAAVIWAIAEAVASSGGVAVGGPHSAGRRQASEHMGATTATRPAARALGLALLTFLVLTLPELGRMIDFANFETFDPNGPGLGNLFGQVSPFEALGIWPSGDFRLAPGDGAVPAAAFHLGIAFALVLFAYGVVQLWRRREIAILAGLGAAALAYGAARLGGTPYTSAKAIEIASPLLAMTILLPLAWVSAGRLILAIRGKLAPLSVAGLLFAVAAGVCSLLALANAPVGPTVYSPTLGEYRKLVGEGPTLVVASPQLLDEEHGGPYLAWELRGGRVCIQSTDEGGKPAGVRFEISGEGESWVLKRVRRPPPGKSPCPLIAVRQARQGPTR